MGGKRKGEELEGEERKGRTGRRNGKLTIEGEERKSEELERAKGGRKRVWKYDPF